MINPLLWDRNIFIFLLSEAILVATAIIILPILIKLIIQWDFNSYTQKQYKLEKNAFLVVTIAIFIFFVKITLLPYFVFTIDKISSIVPGAMCGAGVISYNQFGMNLLYLKIFNIFLLTLWIVINRYDLQEGQYRWFKLKSMLFLLITISIIVEFWLDFSFFNDIDIHTVLNCCSTLYGLLEGMNPLPFGLEKDMLIALFYILWLFIISSYLANNKFFHLIGLVLFAIISYYSVLYFFGTYIYEQPNHNCPFCMFQSDYYYVGYLVWSLLIAGVYIGVSAIFAELFMKRESKNLKKLSTTLLSLFVIICSLYVIVYVAKNKTLLQEQKQEMVMPM